MTTVKILAAHAALTEAQGRPAAPCLEAVRDDFALRTPTEYGGAWAGALTTSRRLIDLGRACPSTSWNVGTSAVAKTLAAQAITDRSIFADPTAQFCGSGIPAGRTERDADGIRLSGTWPSVSGCEDAVFALLGALDADNYAVAVVPVADLRVERTWDMAGMRGTGSHSLVADGVLVSPGRIAAAAPPGEVDRVFYALTVLAPMVGAGRGALEVTADMFASDRRPYMSSHTRMGESPGARQWLAEATALVNRAEQTTLALAGAVDAGDLGAADGPRVHYDLASAARDLRAGVELLLDLGGTRGFRSTGDLQRYWRDIAVGSRHPHLNAYLAAERFGAALVP